MVALSVIGFAGLMSFFTYVAVQRPRTPVEGFFALMSAILVVVGSLELLVSGWHSLDQALTTSITLAAVVATASITFRRRSPAPPTPPPKTALPWEQYGMCVVLVVAGQTALAMLHARLAASPIGRLIDAAPVVTKLGVEGRVVIFIVFFIASQVSTSFVLRGLRRSLRKDWRVAEDSPNRRAYLLALAAFPVLICVVPSLEYGALLASVATRMTLLLIAWWITRHAEDVAEFLSWPLRPFIKRYIHSRWDAVRRRFGRDRPVPAAPVPERLVAAKPGQGATGRTPLPSPRLETAAASLPAIASTFSPSLAAAQSLVVVVVVAITIVTAASRSVSPVRRRRD